MDKLDVGERVATSIIHEYGHILTYRAMDKVGLKEMIEVYDWLNQLAEDYRVSHEIRDGIPMSCLPHCITYDQDLINQEAFLEGVDIYSG